MLRFLLQQLFVLALVGVPFHLLEKRYGTTVKRSWWRSERRVDLAWWLFNSTIGGPFARVLFLLALLQWSLATGVRVAEFPRLLEALRNRSPLAQLPFAAQFVLGLLFADFLGYWFHRLTHKSGVLWRAHAVHHSARTLDWLSATRNHPLSEFLGLCATALPLLLLGFDPAVFASVGPLLGVHGLLLHTNVPWDFGRFRYVIASPQFHRWHHTAQDEGIDKNFAGLFPVWDLLFGTFYLPEKRQPVRFGVDAPMPRTFAAQLVYPFVRPLPTFEISSREKVLTP